MITRCNRRACGGIVRIDQVAWGFHFGWCAKCGARVMAETRIGNGYYRMVAR